MSQQEQSPLFKAWFGGSTVVDELGRPLMVYHGTNKVFETFDAGRIGLRDAGFFGAGIYATPDLAEAEAYAESAVEDAGGEPVTMALHLSIQNPFFWDLSSPEAILATSRELEGFGIKGIDLAGMGNLPDAVERMKFNKGVRAAGHDGVLVMRNGSAVSSENIPVIAEVVAFEPGQVMVLEMSPAEEDEEDRACAPRF